MNDALAQKIKASTARYYRDILGLPDWKTRTDSRMTRQYEAHMFQRLVNFAGSLEGKSILDLGCGWGGVVLDAAQQGRAQSVVGIEPDEERLAIARELLKECGATHAEIFCGIGEKLPFPDNSFDIVASYQVLEHVQDPAQVMAEVARVLKPGGVVHFSTPNYMGFWEPHYKIFWFPLLPKPLGRLYLKLRGRQTGFLGHLNYVNPFSIRKLLRAQHLSFVDLTHKSAAAKLRQSLDRAFARLPGRKLLSAVLNPLASNLLFLTHTCFLNRDQEYLATKA
jgi:ubiquinone/menaquinone biosynthesis C-methylase UbiE